MAGRLTAAALCLILAFAGSGPGRAQDLGVTLSPILTIDTDRAYSESLAGERISRELEARLKALTEENRRIEAELIAEEKDLTERRPTMQPDEFRALADAFDAKVQQIRAEQDGKQRDIQKLREDDRRAFIELVSPILGRIARDHGAVAILERRNVLMSAEAIDITDEAIEAINATLAQQGSGGETQPGGDDTSQGNP